MFSPAVGNAAGYELNAALLVSGFGRDVKAGENAGRHLRHDFAALTLIHQPLARENNEFQGAFTTDASQKTQGRLALAVWVNGVGRLEPVQATGGWLEQVNP